MAIFNGKEEHQISLGKARRMVQAYQKKRSAKSVKAVYFGKQAIKLILNQKGCVGLRAYYAKKTSGTDTLVLIGVDKAGNDIVHGTLAEFGFPCPPYCPTPEKSVT